MPFRPTYGPVAAQVRDYLAQARADGLPFEVAWAAVFMAPSRNTGPVYFPHKTDERHDHVSALRATRAEWEAAYERRPSRLSLALERLAAAELDDSTSTARKSGEERPAMALASFPTPSSRALTSAQRSMAVV